MYPFGDHKRESRFLSNALQLTKDHCILEGSQVLTLCPSSRMMMSMEHW